MQFFLTVRTLEGISIVSLMKVIKEILLAAKLHEQIQFKLVFSCIYIAEQFKFEFDYMLCTMFFISNKHVQLKFYILYEYQFDLENTFEIFH